MGMDLTRPSLWQSPTVVLVLQKKPHHLDTQQCSFSWEWEPQPLNISSYGWAHMERQSLLDILTRCHFGFYWSKQLLELALIHTGRQYSWLKTRDILSPKCTSDKSVQSDILFVRGLVILLHLESIPKVGKIKACWSHDSLAHLTAITLLALLYSSFSKMAAFLCLFYFEI